MPRAHHGQSETEQECLDAASRASSQEEYPVISSTPLTTETFQQSLLQMQQHLMLQQQQFLRDLIDRINPGGGGTPRDQEIEPPAVPREGPFNEQLMTTENLVRASPSSAASPRISDAFTNASAIKWLATQIPEFGGVNSDNVNVWTKRVDRVALLHGANDAVTLLAASSRLVKNARQWYDLQDGSSTDSWVSLKTEITKMFDKRIPFFKSMQRIEARKWLPQKETFDQYVLDKLSLIHGLDLPPRDIIQVLIGGIVSPPVRAAALSLTTETIEDFVDRMRIIAEGCMDTERKPGSANKNKTKLCRNCGGAGHSHQDCRKEVKCFFCKKTGHRQYDCPAIKEKGRNNPAQQRTTSTPAAVTEDCTSAEPIAFVADVSEDQLELSQSSVQVDSLQGQSYNLIALLDTGSAVSFIKYSVYLSFCKFIASELRPTVRKFVNIKDLPLEIMGTINVKFTLREIYFVIIEIEIFRNVLVRDQGSSVSTRFYLGS